VIEHNESVHGSDLGTNAQWRMITQHRRDTENDREIQVIPDKAQSDTDIVENLM